MRVKSFTYEKNFWGTYRKRGLLNSQKMDDHIAKMLNDRWEILSQISHSGDWRTLLPFAKRDAITISFRKP
jgi:hypothetical protein